MAREVRHSPQGREPGEKQTVEGIGLRLRSLVWSVFSLRWCQEPSGGRFQIGG